MMAMMTDQGRAASAGEKIGRALRVLIVEDSFMTARALTRMLQEFGAEVLGPVPSVKRAMEVLDAGGVDGAILDINLGNETVEPVAQRLDEQGLPYFFVTGYSSPKVVMGQRFMGHRLLAKPVEPAVLKQIVREELGGSGGLGVSGESRV